RSAVPDPGVLAAAARIVGDVRDGGDAAVSGYNTRFGGGAASGRLVVPPNEIAAAYAGASRGLIAALEAAIATIKAVHERQRPTDHVVEPVDGVTVARRWSPLDRVGVYVPGGGAAYPSSLLMGAVPAQVAGVTEIAVTCPSAANGSIDAGVLAACHILGITEVYATGGAQAIGALAHGTESIPRVDKIVGPGGAWVTAAKLVVFGTVGVDLPAGPSEAIVIVDRTCDPQIAAADLVCQAEHGPDSIVALVALDYETADAVLVAATAQTNTLDRADIITKALESHGFIAIAPSIEKAIEFTNEWGPEHVSVLTESARAVADALTRAGSVFVGEWTPESAGDYATGANHVLPTGGLATSYGPLSTEDFGSWRQVQELTRAGLERLAPTIRTLAAHEGLTAHGACVDIRLESKPQGEQP
ncbi:MAG: histidinol dehydrogenase, partial [Actinomycetota bacterium]